MLFSEELKFKDLAFGTFPLIFFISYGRKNRNQGHSAFSQERLLL